MNAERVISTAPVINFADTRTTRRSKRAPAMRSNHPDAALIEHCMEYAAQIAISELGYKIDPTNSEFAAFAENVANARAKRAMADLMRCAPTTMDGLRAKAAIVATCLGDWSESGLAQAERNFLISLAEDVIRFQMSSIESDRVSSVLT